MDGGYVVLDLFPEPPIDYKKLVDNGVHWRDHEDLVIWMVWLKDRQKLAAYKVGLYPWLGLPDHLRWHCQ